MELWVALLLAAWVLVTLVVLGACAAAARGDELVREAVRSARDAHWGHLQR